MEKITTIKTVTKTGADTKPKPSTPKSGKKGNKTALVVLGVLGVVVALIVFLAMRKRKTTETNSTSSTSSTSSTTSTSSTSTVTSVPSGAFLSLGQSGSNVIYLQRYLKSKGQNLGTTGPDKNGVDGIFGPLTQAATLAVFGKEYLTRADWDTIPVAYKA